MKILLARENNIKQNENKNKMLNRLSFLSENDDCIQEESRYYHPTILQEMLLDYFAISISN